MYTAAPGRHAPWRQAGMPPYTVPHEPAMRAGVKPACHLTHGSARTCHGGCPHSMSGVDLVVGLRLPFRLVVGLRLPGRLVVGLRLPGHTHATDAHTTFGSADFYERRR
jgi:hypothetical protein